MREPISTICLLLGGLIAIGNWYSIVASRRSGRFVSAVPLIGAALLVVGMLGRPQTRPYAWMGLFLDYGTLAFIVASPRIMRNVWQTSSINLQHRFNGQNNGRSVDVRLFRQHIFVIRCVHEPPIPCNEHGALVNSYGFQGTWREHEGTFALEHYSGDRLLEIRRAGADFATTEKNCRQDQLYPYGSLDGMVLTMIA